MTLLDRFPSEHGLVPGPVPNTANLSPQWLARYLPKYSGLGLVADVFAGPGASAAAVLTGTIAQTYDMTGYNPLEVVVNDYQGRKNGAGRYAITSSGLVPAKATAAADSAVSVSLGGVTTSDIAIGTQTTPEGIAAAIQTGIRGDAPAASSRHYQAYAGATCVYQPPSVSTVTAEALASGVAVDNFLVVPVSGLKSGMTLILKKTGQSNIERQILSLTHEMNGTRVYVASVTPATLYPAGETFETGDDQYVVTGGKMGADQSIVFSSAAAGTDVVASLKLTVATGATQSAGADVVGLQSIPFAAADFSSPAAATAQEMANVINRHLTGAVASVSSSKVVITTDALGSSKNAVALSGVTQALLGLPVVIAEGTDVPATLSLRDGTIVVCVEFDPDHGDTAFADTIDPATIWRQERDKLVSKSTTSYASTTYLALSKPGER